MHWWCQRQWYNCDAACLLLLQYLVNDRLLARCGAQIRIEVIDRATGRLCDSDLSDVYMEVIRADSYWGCKLLGITFAVAAVAAPCGFLQAPISQPASQPASWPRQNLWCLSVVFMVVTVAGGCWGIGSCWGCAGLQDVGSHHPRALRQLPHLASQPGSQTGRRTSALLAPFLDRRAANLQLHNLLCALLCVCCRLNVPPGVCAEWCSVRPALPGCHTHQQPGSS